MFVLLQDEFYIEIILLNTPEMSNKTWQMQKAEQLLKKDNRIWCKHFSAEDTCSNKAPMEINCRLLRARAANPALLPPGNPDSAATSQAAQPWEKLVASAHANIPFALFKKCYGTIQYCDAQICYYLNRRELQGNLKSNAFQEWSSVAVWTKLLPKSPKLFWTRF